MIKKLNAILYLVKTDYVMPLCLVVVLRFNSSIFSHLSANFTFQEKNISWMSLWSFNFFIFMAKVCLMISWGVIGIYAILTMMYICLYVYSLFLINSAK